MFDAIIQNIPGCVRISFLKPGLLEQTIDAAIHDKSFIKDDLEFVISAREWSSVVSFANFDIYKKQFQSVQKFFELMLPEANLIGNEMIKTILSHSSERSAAEQRNT